MAPGPVIALYLAVFYRCLAYISEAGKSHDRDAMLLGGHLADALHNVPAFLCRYNCDDWHSAEHFMSLLLEWHEVPEWHGAPPGILDACRQLFQPELRPGELGLAADLSNLDLAPQHRLAPYLSLLYEACLTMRLIRSYGASSSGDEDSGRFWNTADENWRPKGDEHGAANGVLAAILLPLPAALVTWNRFDETQFHAQAERRWIEGFGDTHWREEGRRFLLGASASVPPAVSSGI
jgi:hypothetical protein